MLTSYLIIHVLMHRYLLLYCVNTHKNSLCPTEVDMHKYTCSFFSTNELDDTCTLIVATPLVHHRCDVLIIKERSWMMQHMCPWSTGGYEISYSAVNIMSWFFCQSYNSCICSNILSITIFTFWTCCSRLKIKKRPNSVFMAWHSLHICLWNVLLQRWTFVTSNIHYIV